MQPITWDWLAGFYQAEGSAILEPHNGRYYQKIAFGQVHPLTELSTFLREHQFNPRAFEGKAPNDKTLYQVVLNGKQCTNFVSTIAPLLRGDCLVRATRFLDNNTIAPKTFVWDYIVGFWEGDGSLSRPSNTWLYRQFSYYVIFSNHNTELLEEIREFLVSIGHTRSRYSTKKHNDLWTLEPVREELNLSHMLLESARLQHRKEQLARHIALYEHDRNSLTDEQTIARYRELLETQQSVEELRNLKQGVKEA